MQRTKTLYTAKEAAKMLKVSHQLITYYARQGKIGEKVGSHYVIRIDEIERFRDEREEQKRERQAR